MAKSIMLLVGIGAVEKVENSIIRAPRREGHSGFFLKLINLLFPEEGLSRKILYE